MEKAIKVKKEVLGLLSHSLGDVTSKTFAATYFDETLPIFLDSALSMLTDRMGKTKAVEKLNTILKQNQVKELS